MSRKRFCEYLSFTRSTLYYKPKEEKTENLKIMELMDKYFIEHPTAEVSQMKSMLTLQGYTINHKRVRRLLRKMGLIAIYPQKNLLLSGCSKYFLPYLLRNIEITYPNQVWSTDISYIPMKEGFMYLYAIIDVYSRFIVGWK